MGFITKILVVCWFGLLYLESAHSHAIHRRQAPFSPAANFGFGSLQEVELNTGNLTRRPIDMLIEDQRQPGSFLYNSGAALMRLTPGQPVTRILGTDEIVRPYQSMDGTSEEARFSIIGGIAQYGTSKIAISDFLNSCVREYDFETDLVTTIVGICGSDVFSSRFLEANESVDARTTFLGAPLELEYVESGDYLIIIDYAYLQVVRYDFATQKVRLLSSSLFEKVPNPSSLLVNPEGNNLYITHSYGLSVFDLNTEAVTLLVGSTVYDQGKGNRPLIEGDFAQASTGQIESLSWLVPNEVIVAVRPGNTEAIVLIDLANKQLTAACVGNNDRTTTVTGDQTQCKINAPTSLAVTNDSVYVATLTHGNYDSYRFNSSSSLFRISRSKGVCTVPSHLQYGSVLPDTVQHAEGAVVHFRCSFGMLFQRTCLARSAGSSEMTWNRPLPDCGSVFSQLLSRLNRRRFKVRAIRTE